MAFEDDRLNQTAINTLLFHSLHTKLHLDSSKTKTLYRLRCASSPSILFAGGTRLCQPASVKQIMTKVIRNQEQRSHLKW